MGERKKRDVRIKADIDQTGRKSYLATFTFVPALRTENSRSFSEKRQIERGRVLIDGWANAFKMLTGKEGFL
jgi:hypothetical protein